MCDVKCITNGVFAGVVAGIVFALFLFLSGMSGVLGISSKMGGMFVHFILSIIAGLIFASVLGWLIRSWGAAIVIGLLFGLIIWLIGPLTLLPVFSVGESWFANWTTAGIHTNLHSLIGLLIYGLVLGLTYCFLKKGKLHKLKKPKLT